MSFRVAGARNCAPCQKWEMREGFVAFPKTMAGVGHMQRTWQDAFSVAGAVEETCSSEMLGGQGADFLRGVAFWSIRSSVLGWWFFAWQVQHFRMDLASLFRGRRSSLDRWSGKITKRIGRRPSALHSTFHFWRKSHRISSFLNVFWCCQTSKKWGSPGRIVSLLMLSSAKIGEVSLNCCVFDVVNFESWGSLAEQLRFQACR